MEFRGKVKSVSRDWKTGKLDITFSLDEGNAEDLNEIAEKDLWVTAKHYKRHRSLNANAYAWVLIGKIATAIKSTKEEVYCRQIMDNPASPCTHIIVKEKAMQRVRQLYRVSVDLGEIQIGDQTGHQLQVFFGSSTYDTKEMATFIDGLVEEAKRLGIETLPPQEIERMNAEWSIQQSKQ